MENLQEAQLNQQAITNEHLDALHTLSGELNDKIDKLNKGLTDHKIEVNVPEFKDFPEIKLPEIKIPEIKIPKIEIPKIPEPKITVKPNITVEPTPVKFPKEMEIKDLKKVIDAIPDPYSIRDEVSKGDPLPIMVVDAQGRQIVDFGGSFSAPNIVGIKGESGIVNPATEEKQDAIIANLPLNEVGRLKTSNLPADITPVTGTITANAQTIPVPTDRVSNVMAHCYGTFSTVNCTFEGSLNSTNGTNGNWFTIQAVRTNANTVETTTGNLSAAPAYGWELSVNALKYMRVRATAFTSGTQNWVFALGSYATEPIPAIQSHAVTLGAAATAIAKAEDSASASANVGVPPMVVRADTLQANAGVSANGDYAFMFCDVDGRVYTNSMITGKTGDTTYQTPRIDSSTHTLQTIEYEHHEIHEGSHFFVDGVQDLSINQVLDFTFTTPNTTTWSHLTWKFDTESETAWYIYEGATATNALANSITPRNNNRNSATTSVNTLKYEVQADLATANADTNVSSATLLQSGISGAGKTVGDDKRERELILKQNTIYCMRAIASTAGYIYFHMGWYEHANKTA
jgi:hypothetical protein